MYSSDRKEWTNLQTEYSKPCGFLILCIKKPLSATEEIQKGTASCLYTSEEESAQLLEQV